MQGIILTSEQAWESFYDAIKKSEEWEGITEEERQYLRKTNRDILAGNCGSARLNKLFQKYAPGTYELSERWFLLK